MDDRGCLAQAMTFRDIHHVAVAIPDELDRGKRMIPSKIHTTKAHPMVRDVEPLTCDVGFANRKDPAAAERRDTLGACLDLVRRVGGNNPLSFLW